MTTEKVKAMIISKRAGKINTEVTYTIKLKIGVCDIDREIHSYSSIDEAVTSNVV
jgi:hypothetical protein